MTFSECIINLVLAFCVASGLFMLLKLIALPFILRKNRKKSDSDLCK